MPVLRSRLTAFDRFDDAMLLFALEDAFGAGRFRIAAGTGDPGAPIWVLAHARGTVHYRPSPWFRGLAGRPEASWAFALPTLEPGRLDVSADAADPDAPAFVRTVWRALRRVATNRLKSGLDSGPLALAACRGGGLWAGHHALERCRAAPRRLIAGAWGPCDDWTAPDTAWHRAARARAVERVGRFDPAAPDDAVADGVSPP